MQVKGLRFYPNQVNLKRGFSAPIAVNVNARSNNVWFTYHEGTRSIKSMIKIQKDVGCVLSEAAEGAAEGEERHRDVISTGKHQYIARLKQA